jgi:hypothetical protein
MVGIRGAFRGPDGAVDSWNFLSQLSKSAAGVPQSPPLPAWTQSFYESAEALSTMLRAEEKGRGL